MSTSLGTMIRLRAIQNKTRELFEGMNNKTYRSQYHPDLSPIGWHLGHCMFIENYWLHEVAREDDSHTAQLQHLYLPENCPKPERGKKLPKLKKLLEQIQQQQDDNDILLMQMKPPFSEHALFKQEFLQNFLIQHYAQHYETMQLVLNQIALKKDYKNFQPKTVLTGKTLSTESIRISAGEHDIGGEFPLTYDNELPRHSQTLAAFDIASHPVTNAEYLNFIEDNGYNNNVWWSKEAWLWRCNAGTFHPEHWRRNKSNQWYGIKHQGPFELEADVPVYGINHYEASAFAKWSNARLPHEHEWEAAVRSGQLHNTGQIWEWCNNTLYPYQGFQAFPYEGYSVPWFDDKHYVLRGASRHTRPEIRRASFRNFYTADKRHIFAGLRLVFE